MTPAATESTTARATAAWAGPNICSTCLLALRVTLGIITVAGLKGRFGLTTASRLVCPADWLARAVANAVPTGPALSPIRRSMWDTLARSPPSITRASPMYIAMERLLGMGVARERCAIDGGHDISRSWAGQTIFPRG